MSVPIEKVKPGWWLITWRGEPRVFEVAKVTRQCPGGTRVWIVTNGYPAKLNANPALIFLKPLNLSQLAEERDA